MYLMDNKTQQKKAQGLHTNTFVPKLRFMLENIIDESGLNTRRISSMLPAWFGAQTRCGNDFRDHHRWYREAVKPPWPSPGNRRRCRHLLRAAGETQSDPPVVCARQTYRYGGRKTLREEFGYHE